MSAVFNRLNKCTLSKNVPHQNHFRQYCFLMISFTIFNAIFFIKIFIISQLGYHFALVFLRISLPIIQNCLLSNMDLPQLHKIPKFTHHKKEDQHTVLKIDRITDGIEP